MDVGPARTDPVLNSHAVPPQAETQLKATPGQSSTLASLPARLPLVIGSRTLAGGPTMEKMISRLLKYFESDRLPRRQLIRALALGPTAVSPSTAAPAAAAGGKGFKA